MPSRKKPAPKKKAVLKKPTAPKKAGMPKNTTTPKKKASPAKKNAPKKIAAKPFGGGVPVFTELFSKILHARNFDTTGEFTVHCNIDGKIASNHPDGNYDSLDEANDAAAEHKHDNPTHKLTVTAAQTS